MNGTILRSATEIQDFVRDNERVHAVGRASKSALHGHARDAAIADLSALSGIVAYQPSEYTVTVRAGTPVTEIAATLTEQGQYLPFDPLLPACATIGGTVATNLSGSRRYRYGGVRDFILGASVVDGAGRAFRVGGKVVKNAAGFDLSKFLVGSLGQYAIMTELTFKVFPDVPRFRSLSFRYAQLDDALGAIAFISGSAFELDALDLLPPPSVHPTCQGEEIGGWALLARLGGFAETLPRRAEGLADSVQRETAALEALELQAQNGLWHPLAGLSGATVVKVVHSPRQVPALDAAISGMERRYGVGGNVTWLATDDLPTLERALGDLGLSGLCLLGAVERPIIGAPLERVLSARVKQVLDPQHKLV